MLLPFTVDVPMQRMPYANWALVGCTLLISAIALVDHISERTKVWSHLNRIDMTAEEERELKEAIQNPPAPSLALKREGFQLWQLFTYPLVHNNVWRLIANVVFLFCFGNAVNSKLGHGWFIGLYSFLGGMAGLVWLMFGSGSALIGASGAIMGITGFFLALYPRNDVRVFYMGTGGLGTIELPSILLVLVCMAYDLIGTAFYGDGSVAYLCHLGGEVVGFLLAMALLFTGFVRSEFYEQNLLQWLGITPMTERPPPLQKKRKAGQA